MEKMFEQFSALIDGILDREELNVYEYIGSVTEEAQSGYNKTQMVRNVYDLQQLIRNAFAEHGSKTALKDSNDEITFEQWDKLSDSVAAYLSGIGVTAGDYVGISGERSISTLVRIIGVIKCGAAYVPIAPDCPDDRKWRIEN
jgi:non-ribosomal peptide synthetase component F